MQRAPYAKGMPAYLDTAGTRMRVHTGRPYSMVYHDDMPIDPPGIVCISLEAIFAYSS